MPPYIYNFAHPQGDTIPEYLASLQQLAGLGTKSSRKQGKTYSQTQVYDKMLEYMATQDERNYNEYLYNEYQSPMSMVRQYQEAGINPAVMFGSGSSASSSPTAASGMDFGQSGPSAEPSSLDVFSQILSLLTGGVSVAGQISDVASETQLRVSQSQESRAHAKLLNTQAENESISVQLNKIDLAYADARKRLENQNLEADLRKKFADVNKIFSDIDVNSATIKEKMMNVKVGESQVALNLAGASAQESVAILNAAKTVGQRLDNDKARILLPYVQRVQEAELMLTKAKTDESKASSQERLAAAGLSLVNTVKQQGLIDAGYCEELVKDMHNKRWTNTVNCVVGNTCNIVKTAVGAMTGTAGLMPPEAPAPAQPFTFTESVSSL